jgi:hypothetical protein
MNDLKEFGEPGTVSGNYVFNENMQKYVLTIDCVEWTLCNEIYSFETIEEMESFINDKYNENFKF